MDADRSDNLRPAEPAIDGTTEAVPSQRPRLPADVADFPSASSRSFNYFKPRRIRATVYEDVTVDVQPDRSRHLIADWAYAFAERPGGGAEGRRDHEAFGLNHAEYRGDAMAVSPRRFELDVSGGCRSRRAVSRWSRGASGWSQTARRKA